MFAGLPELGIFCLGMLGKYRVQKSDAGVGIGTLVGANAPTPPYGGGLAPPTPPLMVGASAPTPPLSRPVGLPNGH